MAFIGRPVDDISVTLGDHRRSQPNPNRQVIDVERVVEHEDYDSRAISDDIALLHLAQPATLTEYVQPACKPDDNLDYDNYTGTASGWGNTRPS